MTYRRSRTALGAVALLAAASCGADGQVGGEAGAVIDAVVEAYGGRAALARVSAYRIHGTIHAFARPSEAPTVRTFSYPDRLRVELWYPAGPEIRILDGDAGWRSDGAGNVIPARGPMLGAMALQAARSGIPWILEAMRDSVRLLGPGAHADTATVGLELRLGPGLALHVFVDPETHLVVRSQSILATATLHAAFGTVYSDFRSVDGVLFPFAEQNFASGTQTGATVIDSVIVNPELEEAAFAPREGTDGSVLRGGVDRS